MADKKPLRPSEILKQRLDESVNRIIETFLGKPPQEYHNALSETLSRKLEDKLEPIHGWLDSIDSKSEELSRSVAQTLDGKLSELGDQSREHERKVEAALLSLNDWKSEIVKEITCALGEKLKATRDDLSGSIKKLSDVVDPLVNPESGILKQYSNLQHDVTSLEKRVSGYTTESCYAVRKLKIWIICSVCTAGAVLVLEVAQWICR